MKKLRKFEINYRERNNNSFSIFYKNWFQIEHSFNFIIQMLYCVSVCKQRNAFAVVNFFFYINQIN